ncbi:MAG: hypothetical protein IJ041_11195 [Clostridia bacterium]|nr:hypothetical protein [Clostridia bacterium]
MKLFFETSLQASSFLLMIPAGILLALLTDLTVPVGRSKPVLDVLVMLFCGFLLAYLVIVTGDERLRLHHLLAVLTGAVLYLTGIRRVFVLIAARIRHVNQENDASCRRKKEKNVE